MTYLEPMLVVNEKDQKNSLYNLLTVFHCTVYGAYYSRAFIVFPPPLHHGKCGAVLEVKNTLTDLLALTGR